MGMDEKVEVKEDGSLEGLVKQIFDLVKDKKESNTLPDKEQLERMIADAVEKSTERSKEQRRGEFETADAERATKEFGIRSMQKMVDTPTKDPQIKEYQKMNDYLYIASTVLGKPATSLKLWQEFKEQGSELRKALRSTVATAGDEFVPTGFSAELEDLVRLEMKVAALHRDIVMPTNPFTLPVAGADATAYLVPEAWSDDVSATANMLPASTRSTANVSLTAKKLGLRHVFSEEMNEDSIIPVLDFVRTGIVQAAANGMETAIVNGDTAGSHEDTDISSSTDIRKAFLGYRAHCNDQTYWTAGANGILTAALVAGVRAKMGKYGVSPSNLALLVSPTSFMNLMKDTTSIQTWDKFGPNAPILNGELARIFGIPIIVSEYVREDLASTGIYGSGKVLTAAFLIHRPSFVWGVRRGITIKSGDLIQTDQTVLVITMRRAFNVLYPIASNTVVYGVRNVALS